jgi:hypothetical protein
METDNISNKTELRFFLITLLSTDIGARDKIDHLKYGLQFAPEEIKNIDFVQEIIQANYNNMNQAIENVYNLIYDKLMKG